MFLPFRLWLTFCDHLQVKMSFLYCSYYYKGKYLTILIIKITVSMILEFFLNLSTFIILVTQISFLLAVQLLSIHPKIYNSVHIFLKYYINNSMDKGGKVYIFFHNNYCIFHLKIKYHCFSGPCMCNPMTQS